MKKMIYYMPGTYGSLLRYCITIATNPKCPVWPRGPLGQLKLHHELKYLQSISYQHYLQLQPDAVIIKHFPRTLDESNYNAIILLSDNELNDMFFAVSMMCRVCDFDFAPERFQTNLYPRIIENLQRAETIEGKNMLNQMIKSFNVSQSNPTANFDRCVNIILGNMRSLRTKHDLLKKYKKESRLVINFTDLLQPDTFLQTLQAICNYFKLEYNKESESRILDEHIMSMNNNCLRYLNKDWVLNRMGIKKHYKNPFIQAFKIDNPKYFDAS